MNVVLLLQVSFQIFIMSFPGGSVIKNLPPSAADTGDAGLIPELGRRPGVRTWLPTPVFLPGKSHGQRNVAGYSPRDGKGSHTTERLSTHTHSSQRTCE